MKTLISGTVVVSDPFEITKQITVYAMGLEPDDVVEFYMISITSPIVVGCPCPPAVVLASVNDEIQHTCCGEPVTLTREKPFVIIDAPLNVKMRAKLVAADEPSTQVVWYNETNTLNVNDRLRGCPCAAAAE